MTLPTQPVTQDLRPDRLRALIHGAAGVGKTTFGAGWYPKTNLLIDLEGGTRFIPSENFVERPQSYSEYSQLVTDLCQPGHAFTTVTIDTGSALVNIADAEAGARYGKVAAGVVEFGKGMADRDGTIIKDLTRLLRTDLSVILLCHSMRVADEELGTDVFLPALPTGSSGKPGIREFAMASVDFMWFAKKNGPLRELVCQPNAKYEVKSRVPMPDTIPLDAAAAFAAVSAGCERLKAQNATPVAA